MQMPLLAGLDYRYRLRKCGAAASRRTLAGDASSHNEGKMDEVEQADELGRRIIFPRRPRI